MNARPTLIPDVLLLEPEVHADDRGFLYESFNQREFEAATGGRVTFVQDNHSHSRRGVLRGLHHQRERPQGKLIRVASGAVFDVAADIRPGSPTFGRWVGVHLSAENRRQLWIPPGLAHGFLVLSESADVLYKTTEYHAPQQECCVIWNDPTLAVDWPLAQPPILSPRDARGEPLRAPEAGRGGGGDRDRS